MVFTGTELPKFSPVHHYSEETPNKRPVMGGTVFLEKFNCIKAVKKKGLQALRGYSRHSHSTYVQKPVPVIDRP
jgi:hypothetical protein